MRKKDFYLWRRLKATVYATEVSDIQDLQQRTQNGCEMNRATPGSFQRVRQSLFGCATSRFEVQVGHFEHFL
jgi:hypothetical protein